MSKYKIINLIDKIFITIAIFLIIYAWINFYLRDLWLTFILSLIFSFACVFILFYFLNKKQSKTSSKKQLTENINEQFLIFKLTSTQNKYKLLYKILANDYNATFENNSLVYFKDNKKHLIVLATKHNIITNEILVNLLDEYIDYNAETLNIICNEVDININKNILKNKHIIFTTKKVLYNDYFNKYNTFPDATNINLKISKLRFKDVIKGLFLETKAKSYFLCGLILIFSSIILPYHYYYIIVGSMLLLFAIICKILPKIL